MRDVEFILRFFALSSDLIFDKENAPSRISLKKFLNEYMDSVTSSEIDGLRSRFISTTEFVLEHIGASAFHNVSSSGESKNASFSPTVFDAVMIATDRVIRGGAKIPNRDFAHRRIIKLSDEKYQGLLYQETMRTVNIQARVNLMQDALYG